MGTGISFLLLGDFFKETGKKVDVLMFGSLISRKKIIPNGQYPPHPTLVFSKLFSGYLIKKMWYLTSNKEKKNRNTI